ncbi:MAG: ATP-binding protein [Candidatus Cloacimonadota bacterium]|nr:ATP-binding protein [Candidatus Cloacimonadota bacterium]
MIKRTLMNQILAHLYKNKIIIIMGARQVGKTTLAREIEKKLNIKSLWLNGDEPDIRNQLTNVTSTQLKSMIGSNKLVFIDEAQRIINIGLTLKLIAENIKDVQLIVTGSSSFELSNQINEPLTGRKIEYFLFPLSFTELCNHSSQIEETRLFQHRMIYGYYPEIVKNPSEENIILNEISESYLYKDVLATGKIKKPAALERLLQAIALQLGKEVSFNELGQLIGIDNQTVERWVDILEKSFVIFRLRSLCRNPRNELKKSRKIYFYDNGIRNAIIKNFNPLFLRQDVGELWENFLISERMKYNQQNEKLANYFFWKSKNQKEIDFIEEYGGNIFAYEFKWNPKKTVKFPLSFRRSYPKAKNEIINQSNFTNFIL